MTSVVTIKHTDGTTEIVKECSSVRVENGVLHLRIQDTSYTSYSRGYPLANIKGYLVEAR